MKARDILTDSATLAGCCVGVGFLSGAEAKEFFGGRTNLLLFALFFVVLTLILRLYCKKKKCFGVNALAQSAFGRFGKVFYAIFCLCCFVCIVTMLAGVQNCLKNWLFDVRFPLYAAVVATISAFVLKKGLKLLKVLNVLSIALSVIFVAVVAAKYGAGRDGREVSHLKPFVYTLFCTTTSLGVVTRLSDNSTAHNATATVVAALLLSALLGVVSWASDFSLDMPLLDRSQGIAQKLLGAVTLTLATVTGTVANALPIVEATADVFCDETLSCGVIFCAATLFSLFGFDFALRYGYLFVAGAGLILVAVLTATMAREGLKSNKSGRRTPTTAPKKRDFH